mmetsp:Transcript_26165/g.25344  ORF Transcript_26165/g.25344 Transcript_26165/m.25344 type:complete len:119 (-) Transcript_26165:159-515(-)
MALFFPVLQLALESLKLLRKLYLLFISQVSFFFQLLFQVSHRFFTVFKLLLDRSFHFIKLFLLEILLLFKLLHQLLILLIFFCQALQAFYLTQQLFVLQLQLVNFLLQDIISLLLTFI